MILTYPLNESSDLSRVELVLGVFFHVSSSSALTNPTVVVRPGRWPLPRGDLLLVEASVDLLHQWLLFIMGGAIRGGGWSLRLWYTKIL